MNHKYTDVLIDGNAYLEIFISNFAALSNRFRLIKVA